MKRVLIFIAILFLWNVGFTQDSTAVQEEEISFFDWCIQDSIPKFTFITDIKKLQKKKYDEEYQPALLVLNRRSGDDTIKVRIRTRGNMRKKVCHFPPIKFKISKGTLEDMELDDIKSYKMVTHCKKFSNNEQWVYKELVAYRMYSTVTDVCFRTHKLEVDYIDENSGKVIDSKVGFIIESEKDLEKRLDGIMVDRSKSHPRHNVPEYVCQMSMFQYMIGNTDWSFGNMHNLKLIKLKEYPYTVPIAYDFDYAGLIETDYSVPDPQLKIDDVTQRIYRDVCQEEAIIKEVIDRFLDKKEEIYACIYSVPELKNRETRSMKHYIDEFFETLEEERNLQRVFMASCD